MTRKRIASACCVALLLPTLEAAEGRERQRPDAIGPAVVAANRPPRAQSSTVRSDSGAAVESCRADAPPQGPEPEDSRWKWRLRAYRHLDCVVTLVDEALAASRTDPRRGVEDETVRLTREDLERIRKLAWWARDAAARIGQ